MSHTSAKLLTAGMAAIVLAGLGAGRSAAQGHDHHAHTGPAGEPVQRPKVFLDKSPRIVAYQLKRLDNQRLLLVERSDDDAKYIPVFEAILTRPGMSPQYRHEAVAALSKLRQLDPASVLLGAIADLPASSRAETQNSAQLGAMLLGLPAEQLEHVLSQLRSATEDDNAMLRELAFAALVVAGKSNEAWNRAIDQDKDGLLAWLGGVQRVPQQSQRNAQRSQVMDVVLNTSRSLEIRSAAIETMSSITAEADGTFTALASFVEIAQLREAAVRTLLTVGREDQSPEAGERILLQLLAYAEATPPEARTSDPFIDAMQLADRMLAHVPIAQARQYRQRLAEISVRLIRIKTVEEEMRYDVPYFAVEAGRPVQIVLQNEDLMPHNLVITVPGALKEVAQLGLQVGPSGGWQGKQYVPESPQVLFATDMVQPHQQSRLTFDAPTEPGEYPYVCTFPQHWYRMYGVMVVVEDLDQWLADPAEPANPLGSNRTFVKAWNLNDFSADLDRGLEGRSNEIGRRLFSEASCLGCHQAESGGGKIGPELNGVFARWKGDAHAVLREILEPAHRIDEKYAMHMILTADGQTISGIITGQSDDAVTVLSNPEAKEPAVIATDDIEEMLQSATSMMPKALLDQYTKDEVLEILAYLKWIGGQSQ